MSSSVSSRSRSGLSSRGAHPAATGGVARARQLDVDAVARVLAINAAVATADIDPQARHARDDARLYLPPRQARRPASVQGQEPVGPGEVADTGSPGSLPAQLGLSAYARASHAPRKGLDLTA